MARLTVLIVDDEPLIRAGLRLVLDGAQGIVIVGEAGDGVEGEELAARLRPDVVLMDVRMPRRDGVAATARIRALPSPPSVVVLTAFATDAYVLGALRASAPQVEGVERVASLSDREAEVADLVAEGLTNADIAARLYLSLPTVKTHLARIFEKLAVTNRVQLALLVHAARRA